MELKNAIKKHERKIKKIYGYALSAITVIVGALFLYQLLGIYFRDAVGDIYSRELVIKKLGEIIVPIIIWIIAIIFGGIFWLAYPDSAPKASRDDVYLANRLKKRIPLEISQEKISSLNSLRKEEQKVKTVKIIAFVSIVLFVIYFLTYMFLPSSFTDKTYANQEVTKMILYIMPVFAIVTIVNIFSKYYELYSVKRQMPFIKDLTAGQKTVTNAQIIDEKKELFTINIIRLAILAVSVAFIIVGVFNGGMRDVLIKAINICTECIGLG